MPSDRWHVIQKRLLTGSGARSHLKVVDWFRISLLAENWSKSTCRVVSGHAYGWWLYTHLSSWLITKFQVKTCHVCWLLPGPEHSRRLVSGLGRACPANTRRRYNVGYTLDFGRDVGDHNPTSIRRQNTNVYPTSVSDVGTTSDSGRTCVFLHSHNLIMLSRMYMLKYNLRCSLDILLAYRSFGKVTPLPHSRKIPTRWRHQFI